MIISCTNLLEVPVRTQVVVMVKFIAIKVVSSWIWKLIKMVLLVFSKYNKKDNSITKTAISHKKPNGWVILLLITN